MAIRSETNSNPNIEQDCAVEAKKMRPSWRWEKTSPIFRQNLRYRYNHHSYNRDVWRGCEWNSYWRNRIGTAAKVDVH
jgi:hypothetical protein